MCAVSNVIREHTLNFYVLQKNLMYLIGDIRFIFFFANMAVTFIIIITTLLA